MNRPPDCCLASDGAPSILYLEVCNRHFEQCPSCTAIRGSWDDSTHCHDCSAQLGRGECNICGEEDKLILDSGQCAGWCQGCLQDAAERQDEGRWSE